MIYSKTDLLLAIQNGESQIVEFKTSFQKEVIESVVAFANTKGGNVVIGIDDNGKIIGTSIGSETIQNYINTIKQNTEPKIIVDIESYIVEEKKILVIQIDEYPIKPVSFKGRYFKRRNNSNHQMTPIEISDTHMKTINSSWDYFIDPYHNIDDIDEQNVKNFIKMAHLTDDVETVYKKFELVKDDKVTFGCYLLFNNNDKAILTDIEIGRFQSETIIKDSLSINGDVISQVQKVMDFIYKHTNKAYVITGKPQRDEVWDYPMDAIREIVVNMIVHRDYRSSGHTTVKIFDDKIEFFNFGKLPDDLSLEQIKSGRYKSHPRNIQIAEVFKAADIIEKYGSGIKRVIDTFKNYGLKEPLFEPMMGGMNVSVYKEKLNVGVNVGVNIGVNVGVKEVYEFIKINQPIKANAIAKNFSDVTQRTIERWLKQLKDEDKIEFKGSPKVGGYVVK
jgi:ATP-dependent DNA helicase RecG